MICEHPTRLFFTLSGVYNILFVLLLLGYAGLDSFQPTYLLVCATLGLIVAAALKCIGIRTKNRTLALVSAPLVFFLLGVLAVGLIESFIAANTLTLFVKILFSTITIILLLLYALAMMRAGDVFGTPARVASIATVFTVWFLVMPPLFPFWFVLSGLAITICVTLQTLMTTLILLQASDVIDL